MWQWLQENAGSLEGFRSTIEGSVQSSQKAYDDAYRQVAGSIFGPGSYRETKDAAAALKRKNEYLRGALGSIRKQELMENIETLADQAEKEYEEYIHSEDYAAWRMADIAQQQKNAKIGMIGAVNAGEGQAAYRENETARTLRAKADEYRALANEKQDAQVMLEDLDTISKMPQEERAMLESYILNRDVNFYQSIGPNSDAAYLESYKTEMAVRPLMEKYGRGTVDRLARSLSRYQNQELSAEVASWAAQKAGKSGWAGAGHSLLSVGANLVGAVTAPVGYLKELSQGGAGQYTTLDPNNAGMLPNLYAGSVRQTVGGKISEGLLGKPGEEIYNAAMSAADNLTRIAVGGKYGSLALAATGSFGQAVSEYSAQGASPAQAIMMGIVSGGLEVVTEKISVENLLDDLGKTLKNPKGFKQILMAALQAGGVEVTEEEASYFGGILAEAAILRGQSGYQQQVRQLIRQGYSEEQAREMADWEVVLEAGETAVQSFLSGTMMSGTMNTAGNTISNVRNWRYEQALKKAKKRAEQAQQKTDAGAKTEDQAAPETAPATVAELGQKVKETMKSVLQPVSVPDINNLEAVENATAYLFESGRINAEEREQAKAYVRQAAEQKARVAEQKAREAEQTAPVADQQENARAEEIPPVGEPRAAQNADMELTAVTQRLNELTAAGDFGQEFQQLSTRYDQLKNNRGGMNDGTGSTVSDGGQAHDALPDQQPAARAGTGQGTGKAAWKTRISQNSARKNLAKALLDGGTVQQVSTQELGFENGTERKNLVEIPQEHWDQELAENARKIYDETGCSVHYLVGKIEVRDSAGNTKGIRGVQRGNEIYIRADHGIYSAEQIGRHESYHAISRTDAGLNRRIANKLTEAFSTEELEEIIARYARQYEGLYSTKDAEEVDQMILEELLANAYADMGDLDTRERQYSETVKAEVEQTLYPRGRQENGTRQTRGPDEGRYSVDDTSIELEKPIEGYPYNMQTVIRGYIDAVDEDLLSFIEDIHSGKAWKGQRYTVGTVHERMANDIERIADVTMKPGSPVIMNTDAVTHIENGHGIDGESDKSMADPLDLARINYVIQNYDAVEIGARKSRGQKNKDNTPAKTIVFSKKINGTYFVVEAVPDTGKAWVVTAYINKNGASQVPDDNSPSLNARNELASAPKYSIDDTEGDVKEQGARGRYSVDETYTEEIDDWNRNGRVAGAQFILGSTGDVLQGLGAIESDIYINGDKINTILKEHPEMTLDEIKRIPEILDDPVLVLESRNAAGVRNNSRLAMIGTVKAQNGKPILCVLDLRPVENKLVLNDLQKVVSSYTKNNAMGLIEKSDVLYLDKKRTTALLRTLGFHNAQRTERSGYVGSISYSNQKVNIRGVPFEEIISDREGAGRYSVDDTEEQEPDYGVVTNALLKQWGARSAYAGKSMTEDAEIYTYDFLVAQPDMTMVQLPDVDTVRNEKGRVDTAKVVDEGMKNARAVGTERDGKVYVKNSYTNRELRIDVSSIRHGVNGAMNRVLTNARLCAAIGDVVQNAIPINALTNKAQGVTGTYAMAQYATDSNGREFVAIVTVEQRGNNVSGIEAYDAVHAVSGRQKNSSQSSTKLQGVYPSMAATISIQELLSVVNSTHQSILPDDVLNALGETRNPAGYYSDSVRYSMDDEDSQAPENEIDPAMIDRELTKQQKMWSDAWLRDRLGEEGFAEYQAKKKQQEQAEQRQRKAEQEKARKQKQETTRQRTEQKKQAAQAREEKQLRNSTAPSMAKKAATDQMLNLFSVSQGKKQEARQIIERYLNKMLEKGSITDEDYKALFDHLYASGVVVVPADEYYAMGRQAIRGNKVFIDPSLRSDLGDDWQDYRRRAFGAGLVLTTQRGSGMGMDEVNKELASILPGLFDGEETDMRTMLDRLLEVAEEGKDENMSLAEYTAVLAGEERITEREVLDNLDRQMDLALRSFVQSAGIESKVRAWAIKERGGITKENIRLKAQLAQERDARREAAQQQRQRRELREMQERTMKELRWLRKNRSRAPEELRESFDRVLSDIDLLAINEPGTRYKDTWERVAESYKKAKASDPNWLPSAELEKVVSRIDGTKIGELDVEALENLYRAATALRTEYYNRNNVLEDEMHRLFDEVFEDTRREIGEAPEGMKYEKLSRWLNLEQLTPMNVIERMVGWNQDSTFYSMAKQLEKGERDIRDYTVKAQRELAGFLTEHEEWVKKADGQGEDSIWYEIEVPELVALGHGDKPIFGPTVKVSMTPAQKVHMYLESKNYNNLCHMAGGRTFVNKALYQEGKRQEAFAKGTTIRMAPETVKELVKDLTTEEMELARLLEHYYNETARAEVNRISNILYGYDRAVTKDYAPIISNQNYTHSEIGTFDSSAEGVGSMKERVQGAKNPSYNISAFDAFERHVDHTARFVGMAVPTRNWTALLNWYQGNTSTKEVLTQKWGQESLDFITGVLNALQTGVTGDASGREFKSQTLQIPDKIMSNYISATFGANPGIVLKQLGSIPLASAYLGLENMPSIQQIGSIDRALISKYTQELEWRTMGYSSPELKVLKENPNWTETNKFTKTVFGGGAITAMDGWAASTLWPWAENKVRREHPELSMGTQAQINAGQSPFYQAVAAEFNDALSRSQSVSDEIHQSEMRKDKNPIHKAFTMFKSDSAQTYNALRQKIGEAQYYQRKLEQLQSSGRADPDTVAELQEKADAGRKAVGAVGLSLLVNSAWAAGIDFLMNLWKYKGKRYKDEEEDELTFGSVAGEMVKDMIGSMAGVVTGGEELAGLLGVVLLDEKWDDVDSMALEQLNAVVKVVTTGLSSSKKFIADAGSVIANGGDFLKFLKDSGPEVLGGIKDTAKAAAMYISGLPANNVEAYLVGIMKWFLPGLEAEYQALMGNVDKAGLSGLEGKALNQRVESILRRGGLSRNGETAEELARLYKEGFAGAIPGGSPSSFSLNGAEYSLNAYDQQSYDGIFADTVGSNLDALVDSEVYRGATDQQRAGMLTRLYEYGKFRAKEEYAAFHEVEGAKATGLNADIMDLDEVSLTPAEVIGIKAKQEMLDEVHGEDDLAKVLEYADWMDAQGWAEEQRELIDAGMPYQKSAAARAAKYEAAGIEGSTAQIIEKTLEEIEPEDGQTSPTDLQKWRAVVNMPFDANTRLAALSMCMTDAQSAKAYLANDNGVDPRMYISYLEDRMDFDADGNGSLTQAEVKAAINSMPELSNTQRAVLWQLSNKSWKARNNPYDSTVGQRIVDTWE